MTISGVRRGRPRSEQSRQAILNAAADILEEQGLQAMTIEQVAKQASASKTTIYRWWPSKGLLAVEAFFNRWASGEQEVAPDTGTLQGDLTQLLSATARSPLIAVLPSLIAEAQSDAALHDAIYKHFLEAKQQTPLPVFLRAVLLRAIDRGEIPPHIDIEVAVDVVRGPFVYRLMARRPLDHGFVSALVDLVIFGLRRGAGASPSSPATRARKTRQPTGS